MMPLAFLLTLDTQPLALSLPQQGYDLLEQHLGQADLDIVHLEAEVRLSSWWGID